MIDNVGTALNVVTSREAILILQAVSESTGVSPSEIMGPSRTVHVSRARHIAIYLVRELLGLSYPTLGSFFGQRDHTSAMHAYQKVRTLVAAEPRWRAEVDRVREMLAGKPPKPRVELAPWRARMITPETAAAVPGLYAPSDGAAE